MNNYIYIQLGGVISKDSGWTKEEFDKFVDGVTELAESFGKDVQSAISFNLASEEEV